MKSPLVDYKTQGTCSRYISFSVGEDGCIHNLRFSGGCNGNTQGLAALVEGMHMDDVESRLAGITCAGHESSCPAQLACAIRKYKNEQ
jgi:uncharacterized protein (TIGR03905 family)